jgi:hypothetical protein
MIISACRLSISFFLSSVILLCVSTSSLSSVLIAEQITEGNWQRLHPRGPDAIGGIGDWALSNGVVCAVISDIEHESGMKEFGGILVDLGHCDKANDQWLLLHLALNLNTDKLTAPDSISAAFDVGEASITVRGVQDGLGLESRYSIVTATKGMEQENLYISHRVTRLEVGEKLSSVGSFTLHPTRSLSSFSLSTINPNFAQGFNLRDVNIWDGESLVKAMLPADVNVLMGADGLSADISYGIQLYSAKHFSQNDVAVDLPRFSVTSDSYTMHGSLNDPSMPIYQKITPEDMVRLQSKDLLPGESIELKFRISIRPENNVAAITNSLYGGKWIRGKINPVDSRIGIFGIEGKPLTNIRPNIKGDFEVRLPEGMNMVSAVISSRGVKKTVRWVVDTDVLNVGIISVPARAATLELPGSYAMRLVFKGLGETIDPSFHDDYVDFRVGGKKKINSRQTNYLSLSGTEGDVRQVQLLPGRYRVYATRGLEFQVTVIDIELRSGETELLKIDWPLRALETPGWINADLHVHSEVSFDTALPLQDRVRSFAAQGSEVIVASEHNRLIDYTQLITDLGLQGSVHLIPGVEFTGMSRTADVPSTNGHTNVFPLVPKPREFSGGLPKHEGRRLRDLMHWSRQESKAALFQLNHPRVIEGLSPDLAYFDHLGVGREFDASQALASKANRALIEPNSAGVRDIDFDLMEILNGSDMQMYELVRRDWFSLLRQGENISGTANSDSHKSKTIVSVPVNYVAIKNDDVSTLDESEFLRSLKQGRMFGTTGPIIDVRIADAKKNITGIGELAKGKQFTLTVKVQAASWVPVESLRVYLNGRLYQEQAIVRGDKVDIAIESDIDAFVVVEVQGEADSMYSDILPGFTPFAFSNPLWIDADTDGKWSAPGV